MLKKLNHSVQAHRFITIFAKLTILQNHMEVATYITTLVKTYRRLFNCLMFYN
jgi:hypothetical protein